MGTMISDPLVGHVLDGRYRVAERIARGGMATVYRAHDMRLDRTVALKAMHPSLAEDESFVSRFIGEAKSAARLSHPNVISVYDQGSDAGVVFLTMEYLPGRTARDLLSERGRLSPDQALHIMEAVLSALGAAHQAGFVHRDVKPENVLLEHQPGEEELGRIKVGDFGLARAIAASNHTKTSGLLIGTVAYLSPEQVARGYADARSDVYSAGILAFELLTGQQPFGGETPLAVAYKHVNSDVPPPSSLVPDIPSEVDGLVAAATRRDPERRPADAAGLLALTTRVREHLRSGSADSAAGHSPTQALAHPRGETLVVGTDDIVPGLNDTATTQERGARHDPWNRLSRFFGSHRGLVALTVVVLLAIVAGGAGYYYGWGRWTSAPKLAGMTVQAANDKAVQLGFDVDEGKPRFSRRVAEGRVIVTDPKAGARILSGGTITVIPSKGKRQVEVPGVAGKTPSAARRLLRDAGLEPGEVSRGYSDTVPAGRVVGTEPGNGETVTVGTTVNLVISSGVQVPSVVNQPLEAAKATLEGKGFVVEVVEKRHDPDVPAGAVITQTPSGGGAPRDSTVRLTVSKGAKPVAVPTVTGQTIDQATATLEAAGFTVNVQDLPGGPGTVVSQTPAGGEEHPPGTKVTIIVF